MKLSQILFKQHLGRQMRKFWYIQGKRTPTDTNADKFLLSKGIDIIDPKEIIQEKHKQRNDDEFGVLGPLPTPIEETQTARNNLQCLEYGDTNVLIKGLSQAQKITKTILFQNTLPDGVEALMQDLTNDIHILVKRIIQTSVIFDAYQELLPKKKDPNRPAFIFRRDYGITDVRKISNLIKKLVQLCDCISGAQIANSRTIIDNAPLCLLFEKEFELFKFSLTMDVLLMSNKCLKPAANLSDGYNATKLPNLYPLHHSIGINRSQVFKCENLYPLSEGYHKKHIHTVFIYCDKTSIKNITELAVTETQIFGRALLKAFTAAASAARQRFGSGAKELPEPVTVQCVHSDGKEFYFSVYQLNTLNLNGNDGIKNYYWTLPKLELYKAGGYIEGKPILESYNPEVFTRLLAFYMNN